MKRFIKTIQNKNSSVNNLQKSDLISKTALLVRRALSAPLSLFIYFFFGGGIVSSSILSEFVFKVYCRQQGVTSY